MEVLGVVGSVNRIFRLPADYLVIGVIDGTVFLEENVHDRISVRFFIEKLRVSRLHDLRESLAELLLWTLTRRRLAQLGHRRRDGLIEFRSAGAECYGQR